ncbi:high-affinity nicotinic acid transporter [Diplodia corticola]|uniref:High-affinity nicotinic acid transporter n=1 Tax=Diplodia corticola TaxID=236234 RepID=A0A1J9RL28_9PEZI|nr:high-affinity nicotinic acid transporter [Diplodia corticola]OJD29215.1 high-affinity nicotinic acid transporter [Diplodia corticola]
MAESKTAAATDTIVVESPSSSSIAANEFHDGSHEGKKAFLASFTAEEDRAIRRKVDRKFLLLLGLIYLFKNIDYTNAASVKVLQVGEPSNVLNELKMSANEYNWVQSIYYIAYILFEVPSNLLLKKTSPRNWQTRIIVSWGTVLACHAAVKNKAGLYTARFFLGAMEAGMFPGLAVQLCSWYRADEIQKPFMWMFAIQNTSGIVGSLVAYGVSYMNGLGGLSAWRWVYLLEGIATILFGGVVWAVLPDYPKSPRSNSWLTPREQEYLEARLADNAPKTHEPSFRKTEVMAALKDLRTYSFMLIHFTMNLAGYGLTWQLPTITTALGYAGLPRNQLLNIPPAAGSVLCIIFCGWFLRQAYLTRPMFVMMINVIMLIAYGVLAGVSSRVAVYTCIVIGYAMSAAICVPFFTWRSSTLSGATGAAFGLALQNCVGQVGGVVGPQLFQDKYAYNGYKVPFAICAAMCGSTCLAIAWSWWLTKDLEHDIRRIRRLRLKAAKQGEVYADDDVDMSGQRKFFNGLRKRAEV